MPNITHTQHNTWAAIFDLPEEFCNKQTTTSLITINWKQIKQIVTKQIHVNSFKVLKIEQIQNCKRMELVLQKITEKRHSQWNVVTQNPLLFKDCTLFCLFTFDFTSLWLIIYCCLSLLLFWFTLNVSFKFK